MHLPAILRRPPGQTDPILGDRTEHQTPLEERINVSLHGTALFLSVLGLGYLLPRAMASGSNVHVAAIAIYGVSMVLLFLTSVLYHGATGPVAKPRLQVLDYAAVFLLIAGSYTPLTLITMNGPRGWFVFGVVWFLALTGIVAQPFMAGRHRLWGLAHYIATGWAIMLAGPTVLDLIPAGAFPWILAGGLAYTLGTPFYLARQVRFSHAIWHTMVLVGTVCVWVAVAQYVVPGAS